ncbi:MAG: hypothetical protein Q4A63_02560 [Butyricicoccus pullicaecorum]|nr:hypothetical protein [Butyricicoccus pullicaecorum]MDO4668680.1 hypothetical protein [Butyricicoccus pullicaecorum]
MKKRNLKVLALIIALCVSAALMSAVNAAAAQESNKQTTTNLTLMEQAHNSGDTFSSNSASTAEAYESDEAVSTGEQAKAEETRRAEIAEQYSIYEPYGMTYDKEKDRFFYNGQMVRYFKDQIGTENTNSFFFEDGVVDVEPMKDTNGTLTGLKLSSDIDFRARTEKEIKAEFDAVGMAENSGSFEMGDPNERDDSLDAYTAFGVSYDQSTQKWIYDGKIIHILYDADHNTYCCGSSASDAVNLKVIRDKSGNIEKLMEAEVQELEQYVK